MNTTLHSFMDIFETAFSDGQSTVWLKKITIPIIQRDYAQGRIDPDISRIRGRFLDSLYHAVVEKPITLDFVYGDIDENGIMTPLDGQQRLTTLFLLHWYAAKRAGISKEESAFLSNFGYETRYSARYFCKELTEFTPSFSGAISEEIVDQAWFPLDWQKDPTISSMLVMLDDIDNSFRNVNDLWERLKDGAITFYFLPIKDMGLTDELYIKMNSRGKPLTRFEHFKAELERCIRAADDTTAKRIMRKIDRDWTDMLWQYRDSGNGDSDDYVTDDEFLRYFRFICDIICYHDGKSPQGRSTDEFDLLSDYFSGDKDTVLRNVETLELYFDCWCNIEGFANPKEFLESCMSHEHCEGKILIDSRYKVDIFGDCLHAYADKNGRLRLFPLVRIVLLYAVISFLRNKGITFDDFVIRLRSINNLILNSNDEISDRVDRNRLPAILRQVDAIMITGEIDDSIDSNFNVNQLTEEKEKKAYLQLHPESSAKVHLLEDHPMMKGQLSILGLENIDYAVRFVSLFTCDWDLIDCAMMTIGDYGQQQRNKHHYQYASRRMQLAWDELFHKSANNGFDYTKEVLVKLLQRESTFTNEILSTICDEFVLSCESSNIYPWRYYFVKYKSFRPGSYGILSNRDKTNTPYKISIMQTRTQWSSNTYVPYFMEADPAHVAKDLMGQQLVYRDHHILCENDAYIVCENETNTVIETISISQDDHGIDTEDRVVLLKSVISKYKTIEDAENISEVNRNDS